MRHLFPAVLAGGCGIWGVLGCSAATDQSLAANLTISVTGCADGQREGFKDVTAYPHIAGCSGAWTIPGIDGQDPGTAPACPGLPTANTTVPACARGAGDDGANPAGASCNVADLCGVGWHVCTGAADVEQSSPTGCSGATDADDVPLFFATRQSSNGCGQCATGASTDASCDSAACTAGCLETALTSNDVFGCGNFGATAPISDCGPLDRFSHDLCSGLVGSPWTCDLPGTADDTGLCEAFTISKSDVTYGGVLCCRDPNLPPDCSAATSRPSGLWPPNHKMASIEITGVVDPDPDDQVTLQVTSIFQDEPVNALGDGNTAPDGDGLGTSLAQVRAERSGTADGRVYHVAFTATDLAGATCSGSVAVCVPHDQGRGSACVDGGPLYDSTAP
jgi:hypothetical protein